MKLLRLTLLLLLAPSSSAAQDPVVHDVPRSNSDIVIDGAIDETAWDHATSLPLSYEVRPGENIDPPVRTTCLITYDDRNVYFGFRAEDPDPSLIRARYSDRDRAWADDWVGIVLDTFNDQRRAYELMSTPLGVQIDAINDDVGGNYDDSWNAIWRSAGRITDDGFEVEMAIPFNQIRFQQVDGDQIWGFDAIRSWPRGNRHHIGVFPRDRNKNSYLSQTIKLRGMQGASPGKNLEVIPTVTANRTDNRSDFPDGKMDSGPTEADVGVSLRWGITPFMSLNGAINPDFSQIEADALQLDVNEQFALFFRETRPFFLEGADYFNSGQNLVYTRSIADPTAAGKLTGKQGRHTWGVFSAIDDVTNVVIPGPEGSFSDSFDMENASTAARYRMDFASNSAIGATVTDRRGDGYSNSVYSVDTVYRFTEKDQIRASFALSSTEYNGAMVDSLGLDAGTMTDEAAGLNYSHSERGWWIDADFESFGTDYRTDLGFRPNVGVRSGRISGAKVWWGKPGARFHRGAWGGAVRGSEQEGGELIERKVETWLNTNGPRQSFFWFNANSAENRFSDTNFDTWGVSGGFEAQATGNLSISFSSGLSEWIDFSNVQSARRRNLRSGFRYTLGRHLNLHIAHTYRAFHVDGGRLLRVHAPELRLIHQFNTKAFLRVIAQYTSVRREPTLFDSTVDSRSQDLLTQFLFTYKVNPQTALYLGYGDNQSGNQDFDLTRSDRTFFAKLGYAWVR